ncbi:MAG: hypothetical protein RR744_11105 [Cellulosilyticaceae bacterium]
MKLTRRFLAPYDVYLVTISCNEEGLELQTYSKQDYTVSLSLTPIQDEVSYSLYGQRLLKMYRAYGTLDVKLTYNQVVFIQDTFYKPVCIKTYHSHQVIDLERL